MKKLDKFIIQSFIGPFIAILLIVIFILAMQFLWVYIDELVGRGLSFGVIMEFMFWGVCSQALPLSLPLATLLASMMTLGQMSENSELVALKASGISLTRIMMPLMAISAIICIGTFYVVNDLSPYATNKIFTLRDDIGRTKSEIKIPVGTFYDGIDGYILRIEDSVCIISSLSDKDFILFVIESKFSKHILLKTCVLDFIFIHVFNS